MALPRSQEGISPLGIVVVAKRSVIPRRGCPPADLMRFRFAACRFPSMVYQTKCKAPASMLDAYCLTMMRKIPRRVSFLVWFLYYRKVSFSIVFWVFGLRCVRWVRLVKDGFGTNSRFWQCWSTELVHKWSLFENVDLFHLVCLLMLPLTNSLSYWVLSCIRLLPGKNPLISWSLRGWAVVDRRVRLLRWK